MTAAASTASPAMGEELLGLFGPQDPHDEEVPDRTAEEAIDAWLFDMRVHRDLLSAKIEELERLKRDKAEGSHPPELAEIENELLKLTNHELELALEAYDCPFEWWVQIDG